VRDYELGLEWQPYKAFEFTATWVIMTELLKIAHLKQQATKSIEITSSVFFRNIQFLNIKKTSEALSEYLMFFYF
jgi:hypothetical protein